MNLFGEIEYCYSHLDEAGKNGKIAAKKTSNGIAAENLVVADLFIRGHEAVVFGGADTDIIAIIDGEIVRLQVKTSANLNFGAATHQSKNGRDLLSYRDKIEGFAFVYLLRRAVYYIHPLAINAGTLTIPQSHWGRQHCDDSFNEFLRRLAAGV